jgi:uncharacterized membrane protein
MIGLSNMRRSITNLFSISGFLRFSSVIFLVTLLNCRHDGINADTLDPVCFQRDVLPVFQNSCAISGCHSQGGGRGGYDFSGYTSIMKAITPFDAQKSKAYQSITGKAFVQLMPPNGVVSENDRILIRVWIDQGAKNTTCSSTAAIPDTSTNVNKPPTNVVVGKQVCFQQDLLPVLVSSCAISGCHDQTTHRDGYNISSYATVMTNLVVAGSPNSSRLYTSVKNNSMPPKPYSSLTQAVKDSLFNWIKNGARNDVCTSSCDTTGIITYQNQIATLLSKNCTSCHSGSSAQKGIILDNYASVKSYLNNGKLMAAVMGTSIQMPPSYKLSTCEMRQLQLWQAGGAIQN